MQRIIDGIKRFRREQFPGMKAEFEELSRVKQNPLAMLITCSDSRVNPNLVTHTQPGDIFLQRNAGNIVPPYGQDATSEAATIEYGLEVLGIRNLIVCGHSHCGAMQALLTHGAVDELPSAKAWFAHAHATRKVVEAKYGDRLSGTELANKAAQENVLIQLSHLRTHPSVAGRLAVGAVELFGWYYEFETGLIYAHDEAEAAFRPIDSEAPNRPRGKKKAAAKGAKR